MPTARELVVQCRPASRCGSNARILLAPEHEWLTVTGSFDEHGLARIRPVPAGNYDLQLLRNDQVVREQSAEISASRDVTRVEIQLPSTTVHGLVTRDGDRVREGRVLFQPRVASGGMPAVQVDRKSGSLVSTEFLGSVPARPVSIDVGFDGAFTLEDFTPGEYTVMYRSALAESSPRNVTIAEGRDEMLRIDLPSGEIRGRVTGEDGKPVDWAGVTLRQSDGAERSIETRPDGTFAFAGVSPGRVTLHATNDAGEGTAEVDVRSGRPAETAIVLQARDAARIAVKVRDANAPARDATVVMRGISGGTAATTISDLNGAATFKLLSAANVQLAAFHPTLGWSFAPPVGVERGQTKEVLLAMEPRSNGALVVRGSRQLRGVEIFAPTGFPLHEYLRLAGRSSFVDADRPLTLDGLPPGRYLVHVDNVSRMVDVVRGRAEAITLP